MQATKKISEITVVNNQRQDFGELEELTTSIKEHGVLLPLIISSKGDLIAGERRLKAAIAAGLEEVPVRVVDFKKVQADEVQIAENVNRKNFTLLEEAAAYKTYIARNKKTAEYLAQKLGKTTQYVERRVRLLDCDDKVREALAQEKIKLGHANLLSQLTPAQQRVLLKELLSDKYSVEQLEDQLAFIEGIQYEDGKPRLKTEQKTLLQSAGNELSEDRGLAESAAFRKELQAYIDRQRSYFKERKVNVFKTLAQLKKKHPEAVEVSRYDWQNESGVTYAKAANYLMKGSLDYGLILKITDSWSAALEKAIYRLKGPYVAPTKKKSSDAKEEAVDEAEAIASLEASREDKLKYKIRHFKNAWLREHGATHLKAGTVPVKVLGVLQLMQAHPDWNNDTPYKQTAETLGISGRARISVKLLLEATPKQLDKIQRLFLLQYYNQHMDNEVLERTAVMAGLSYEDEFEVSEDFAKLFGKEQLFSLADELGIEAVAKRKSDLVEIVVNGHEKGKVPKAFKRA